MRTIPREEAPAHVRRMIEQLENPAEPEPAAAATEAADEEAFDPDADDAGEHLLEWRKYPIRLKSGKTLSVWIFPLAGSELLTVQRLIDALPAADKRVRSLVVQVIACCRRGPSREAPPTWDYQKHRNKILSQLSSEQLQDIVLISARLGRGREYLPPSVRSSLRSMQGLCARWSSASESWDDCPQELLTTTREFASECGRALLLDGSPDPTPG